MKSQMQKEKKKNGGIVELLVPTHFSKKNLFMRGRKLFWADKIWGGCSKLEN